MKKIFFSLVLFGFSFTAHAGMYSALVQTMEVVAPAETKLAVQQTKQIAETFNKKVKKFAKSDQSERKKTVLREELLYLMDQNKSKLDSVLAFVPEKFQGYILQDFAAITTLVKDESFAAASAKLQVIVADCQ